MLLWTIVNTSTNLCIFHVLFLHGSQFRARKHIFLWGVGVRKQLWSSQTAKTQQYTKENWFGGYNFFTIWNLMQFLWGSLCTGSDKNGKFQSLCRISWRQKTKMTKFAAKEKRAFCKQNQACIHPKWMVLIIWTLGFTSRDTGEDNDGTLGHQKCHGWIRFISIYVLFHFSPGWNIEMFACSQCLKKLGLSRIFIFHYPAESWNGWGSVPSSFQQIWGCCQKISEVNIFCRRFSLVQDVCRTFLLDAANPCDGDPFSQSQIWDSQDFVRLATKNLPKLQSFSKARTDDRLLMVLKIWWVMKNRLGKLFLKHA